MSVLGWHQYCFLMMNMRRIKPVILVLGLLLTFSVFQNCGGSSQFAEVQPLSKKSTPIGSTAEYTKISYSFDKVIEDTLRSESRSLEIDLSTGLVIISNDDVTAECTTDDERLAALDALLATSSVCEATASLPAGYYCSLGFDSTQITLSNETSSLAMIPHMCGRGVFLCGEADAELHSILRSLSDSPPAGCSL